MKIDTHITDMTEQELVKLHHTHSARCVTSVIEGQPDDVLHQTEVIKDIEDEMSRRFPHLLVEIYNGDQETE